MRHQVRGETKGEAASGTPVLGLQTDGRRGCGELYVGGGKGLDLGKESVVLKEGCAIEGMESLCRPTERWGGGAGSQEQGSHREG